MEEKNMKCTKCLSELQQGATFCIKCGSKVNMQYNTTGQNAGQQMGYMPGQQSQQSKYMPGYQNQQSKYMPGYQNQQSKYMPGYQNQQSNYMPSQQMPNQQMGYMPGSQMPNQQGTANALQNAGKGNLGKGKKSKAKFAIIASILSLAIVLGVIALIIGVFDKEKPSSQKGTEGNKETEVSTGVAGGNEEQAKHTIMIYMIGSDLETKNRAASADIKEMMEAQYGEEIKVILQTGGAKKWWTDGIEDGMVQRFEVKTGEIIELDNLGKINMACGDSLADFMKFAGDEYPAEKYTLVLWNHGGGIPISFGVDENYEDEALTDIRLKEALQEADIQFESIVMDACNMCTLEIAMAVKDYANYMVAAESYTAGSGMYYISWLEYMAENNEAIGSQYCEMLVTDYMDSIDDDSYVVSMSSIELNKIEKVYDAYVDYADSVYSKINSGGYADYTKAREECGLYEYTDSVDIITLATKYKTDKSDALVTAVVNAVDHTESDYIYGHGLAVYSPHNYVNYYSDARDGMEDLGYDKKILKLYDAYASIYLAYLGERYVDDYAGDWYNNTIAGQYVASGTNSGEYPMATEVVDGNNVINYNSINWETLSYIDVNMSTVIDSNSAIFYGIDYYYEYDKYGNVLLECPKNWVHINGYMSTYLAVTSYEDDETGKWMEMGTVFARCNGEEILILIYFDDENPKGMIAGYVYFDFESLSETAHGQTVFNFKDGDDVELINPILSTATDDITYDNIIGEHFDGGELRITYSPIDLSDSMVICGYTVYDIYGNSYETEGFLYE